MQLRRGERFIRSQGDRRLPEELQKGIARKWAVSVAKIPPNAKRWLIFTDQKVFPSHKAPTEHVLIFSAGHGYIRLHQNPEKNDQRIINREMGKR